MNRLREEKPDSSYCLYPPAVTKTLDITEQIDDGSIRYVIRNRVTSRYFQLKPPEFRIFQDINGSHNLITIAKGGPDNSSPNVSLPALIKFLAKLDALGLLARGGAQPVPPMRVEKGLYPTIRFFNPDQFLTWLDNRLGWVFTRRFVFSSLFLFGFVAL